MTIERTNLTRREAKEVTRRRLLEAALAILDEEGEAALTTTNVTRRVGVAQSTFYVHFHDMDDLLHSLLADFIAQMDRRTRLARKLATTNPLDEERLRDTYRVPLQDRITHPRIFRLLLRSRLDRSSPLHEMATGLIVDAVRDLITDLGRAGLPMETEKDRRRAAMIAESTIAMYETLVFGHLEGRYPDIEEIVDVLVSFIHGYRRFHPSGASRSIGH